MALPQKILLSDLLKHKVLCDKGIDHGLGMMAWMHPPVHRLLGWISKPSSLSLSRHIWKLDQLRGISNEKAYVKGNPSIFEISTLDRLPTLMGADLLARSGNRLASIVDLVFDPKKGEILHYLVARSDPRIPGTSRWRLFLDIIEDQQPGMIATNLDTLDQLPLAKSSIREDLLKQTRTFRDKFEIISGKATDRLEGWLDEKASFLQDSNFDVEASSYEQENQNNWIDDDSFIEDPRQGKVSESTNSDFSTPLEKQDDPWI